MKKLGVIDIGSGNVFSIENVLRRVNVEYTFVTTSEEILECSHVILPGVGAFDDYISRLKEIGIFDTLVEFHATKIYLLGICIGMHVLAESSDEGDLVGLGLIPGHVKRLDTHLVTPHMGWNSIVGENQLLNSIDLVKGFYFLHNYHFEVRNINSMAAFADYGLDISCVVNEKRVYGVQFHPEKSHNNGEVLFRNFLELT